MLMTAYSNIEKLYNAGAHFVLCGAKEIVYGDDDKKSKAAKAPNLCTKGSVFLDKKGNWRSAKPYKWKRRKPSLQQILSHKAMGNMIGIAPYSLKALVLDVDKGDPLILADELQSCNIAHLRVPSMKGSHFWIPVNHPIPLGVKGKKDRPIVQWAWEYNGVSGDTRCNGGYVVLHNDFDPAQIGCNDHLTIKNLRLKYARKEQLPEAKHGVGIKKLKSAQQDWSSSIIEKAFARHPGRHTGLWQAVAELTSRNMDVQPAIQHAISLGLERDKEFEHQIQSGIETGNIWRTTAFYDKAVKQGQINPKQTRNEGQSVAELQEIAHEGFTGIDEKSLERALELMGIEIVLDERWRDKIIWRRLATEDWQDLSDEREYKWIRHIAENYTYEKEHSTSKGTWYSTQPLRYAPNQFNGFLQAIAPRVDLFKELLENMPEWDGKRRAHKILDFVFGQTHIAAHEEYQEQLSRQMFFHVVQRTYEPGCHQPWLPVIVGNQGIGKSRLFSIMALKDRYFVDQINVAKTSKQLAERMAGKAIGEISEMGGMSQGSIETIKSYLSSIDDGGDRAAYARNTKQELRRYALFGSSNKIETLPNDETGNRRFLPIPVYKEKGDTLSEEEWNQLKSAIPQVYAETIHDYKAGKNYTKMPADIAKIRDELLDAHRNADPLEADIERVCDTDSAYTVVLAWREMGNKGMPSKAERNNIGKAFRNIGWESKSVRINGKVTRRFVHKDNPGPYTDANPITE